MKQKLIYALCGIAVAAGVTACDNSDDVDIYDITGTTAQTSQVRLVDATTSALTFEWGAVANAVAYGYELTDADGKAVVGGTTEETRCKFDGLDLYTNYTLSVVVFDAVGSGNAQSAPVSCTAHTLFYAPISNRRCEYESFLRDAEKGQVYIATITEDRSYAGYDESWFGEFTIKGFFGSSGDLVFRVNHDNTITIVNATGYDENGYAMVSTGLQRPNNLKTLYIDEESSVFDYEYSQLTYMARLSNTEMKSETASW